MTRTITKSRPAREPAGARSGKTGKREQTKATNREAILAAAREVFGRLGYGETTVRDIVGQTGLASGTFYNYFKSKEEVFQALLSESALRITARIRAERVRASTFEQFLRGALYTYFDYLASDKAMFQVIRRNTGAMRVRMETPEAVAGFEEIRDWVQQDVDEGVLPRIDAGYFTAAAVGMAQEIGEEMLSRGEADVRGAADFAAELILKGLHGLPRVD